MRISTTQLYTDATRNMLEGQSKLAEVQSRISSGKNFTTLAEDPVGANHVVNLKKEIAQLSMFQTNIDATRRRLELEETTLSDLNTAMDRARELTIQAANNTLTDSDRLSISFEFDQLVSYMANLMNSKDAKGEYLFSGSKGSTQTYALEGGRYSYQGDDAHREIQVASSVYVAATDAGKTIFESISGEPGVQVTGDLAASVTSYTITDIDQYESFVRQNGDIRLSVDRVDLGGSVFEQRYSVLNSAGLPVSDASGTPLDGIPYTDATNQIDIGLSGLALSLTLPLDADLAAATDLPLEARLAYQREDTNILNAMLASSEALKTPVTGDPEGLKAYNAQMALMLEQFTTAQQRITEAQASVGARINSVENAEYSNQDFKLMTQATLSAVEDLDYAEASTELAKRQLALEASFASFAKIQGLSLFNYIN